MVKNMPKIITITANTAIDYFFEVEGLVTRDNIVAQSSADFACGKGVNVAKAVTCLQSPVTCLGFVGHLSKDLFESLNSELLTSNFTLVDGKSRTNLTLFDVIDDKETHIRTSGFTVNEKDCLSLLDRITGQVRANDIVIISGSLPSNAPDSFYQDIIELCHSKQAFSFLDSSGIALQLGVKAKPFILKPNLHELEELVGRALMDEQAIVTAARQLTDSGVRWVYVSMAEKGFIALNKDVAYAVTVQHVAEHRQTSVGCGDALVAGLAVATLNNSNLEDKLRLAAACATANLFSIEPGCFTPVLIDEILPQVSIKDIAV